MRHILRDLRFTLRSLSKSPGFAVAAVLTLALGIGANTAIFSIVYALLLRPLPYADSAHLVVLRETTPAVGTVSVSYPDFRDWRSRTSRFSRMAFVHRADFDLGGTSRPEAISADVVSPDFLSLLGVRPLVGRDFSASEAGPASNPVAILSYPLWQSRFGGDPKALGRTIKLDGLPVTVVGITPPGFRSLDKAQVLLPTGPWLEKHPDTEDRGARGDSVVIGRLATGATLADARAEMGTIATRLARAYPTSNDQFGVTLEPLRDFLVGDARRLVMVLFGAVMFVLLIACGNVANLLLSRRETRAREIAVRLALGASRLRLVTQIMIESLVLALSGGLLGAILALGGIRVVAHLVPPELLGNTSLGLNGAVLLFTLGITLLVALLFGTAPAMHHAETAMYSALKEGRRAGAGSRVAFSRGLLAGSEIALALALLVAAGLMVKSMVILSAVNPGFTTEHVVTTTLDLRAPRYAKREEALGFWRQLVGRIESMPGIQHAALGTVVPFTGDHDRADITVEGMPLPSPGNFPHPDIHIVSPGYLGALGISLLRGRDFAPTDGNDSPLVGIINSEIARKYFPGGDPIGKRFMF
ncbi:MAG TPA: ABC transporter permease, partial [Thermoanaerobaculia bacterium]|nr:ABC transporter permease [Thermoanaerobaculia bacterium]